MRSPMISTAVHSGLAIIHDHDANSLFFHPGRLLRSATHVEFGFTESAKRLGDPETSLPGVVPCEATGHLWK